MVYNGILMETIGISVMISIGLLFFFFFFCRDQGFIYSKVFLVLFVVKL